MDWVLCAFFYLLPNKTRVKWREKMLFLAAFCFFLLVAEAQSIKSLIFVFLKTE